MTTYETGNVTEADLIACVPHLRAFARVLTKSRDRADDLVQDAIVRALTAAHQFQPGTNLKAWIFTILRNLYYNDFRKNSARMQSLDDMPGFEPAVSATQESWLEFSDFCRALQQLGADKREALILVGASGLSCEEAAKVCDCPAGTIKSRVSRARRELLDMLEADSVRGSRRDMPPMTAYSGRLFDRNDASPAVIFAS